MTMLVLKSSTANAYSDALAASMQQVVNLIFKTDAEFQSTRFAFGEQSNKHCIFT